MMRIQSCEQLQKFCKPEKCERLFKFCNQIEAKLRDILQDNEHLRDPMVLIETAYCVLITLIVFFLWYVDFNVMSFVSRI